MFSGLYSDETLDIKPGTDSHSKITLPNKGLKRTDTYGFGDHLIHIKIEIPKYLIVLTFLIQFYSFYSLFLGIYRQNRCHSSSRSQYLRTESVEQLMESTLGQVLNQFFIFIDFLVLKFNS